jgi:hypothetical protein
MNDHGYVSFVVVMFEPSILCGNEWSWICFVCSTMTTTNGTYPWSFITTQNTWFKHDYDKRNISMIIHYHTEYLVQTWLRQMKHIHDHSLNDHGYVPFVVVIVESSILCGNEWSWICLSMIIHYHTEYLVHLWLRQTKHIHHHSLPNIILDWSMTTTNETYPWSFITTHNTWFIYNYEWSWICFVCRSHSWTNYYVW